MVSSGGGEENVYLHIGQIMQGSLSLTRGCGYGRKKVAFVLVVVPVVFRVGSSEDDSLSSDVESLEPHPPKKTHCSAKSKEVSTQ